MQGTTDQRVDDIDAVADLSDPAEPGPQHEARGPAENDQQDVTVDMTLTAQGGPAHVMIGEQVKSRVQQLAGVRNVNVNVVWNPPWTPERISADARKQLGIE